MRRLVFGILVLNLSAATVTPQAGKGEPAQVGTTRVAVVNITMIFSKYEKARLLNKELAAFSRAWEFERCQMEIARLKAALEGENLPAMLKTELEGKIQAARQRQNLLTNVERNRKSGDALVAIWVDIRDAIRQYAAEKGIDVVLGYGDPLEKGMLDLLPNVERKMEMIDQGGMVALHSSPRADISQALVDALNKQHRAKQKSRE